MLEESLTEQQTHYLLKTRQENLQQQIGKSFDEILEQRELESIITLFDGKESHDPTPSLPFRKLAAFEAQRVNRPDIPDSRFDDIDDMDYLSNINESYIALIRESRFNPKSLKLITNQGQIGKDIFPKLNFYSFYPTNPPKLGFTEWLNRQISGSKIDVYSSAEMWRYKTRWQNYCHERMLNTSPCQQIIKRIIDIVTSPIYDDMTKENRIYQLQHGIILKETDKTFVFHIPFREFSDISATPHYAVKYIKSVEAAFFLPAAAHEKTRYFSKEGATLNNFLAYLKTLDVRVEYPLQRQLETSSHILRFYRECFEKNGDVENISGYFLSTRPNQYHILDSLRSAVIRNGSDALVRHVTHLSRHYPEWMRKIKGLIIDPMDSDAQVAKNTSKIDELENEIESGSFVPFDEMLELPSDEFHRQYLSQMRQLYQEQKQKFIECAKLYCQQYPEKNGVPASPLDYRQVLDDIFRRVYEVNLEK